MILWNRIHSSSPFANSDILRVETIMWISVQEQKNMGAQKGWQKNQKSRQKKSFILISKLLIQISKATHAFGSQEEYTQTSLEVLSHQCSVLYRLSSSINNRIHNTVTAANVPILWKIVYVKKKRERWKSLLIWPISPLKMQRNQRIRWILHFYRMQGRQKNSCRFSPVRHHLMTLGPF